MASIARTGAHPDATSDGDLGLALNSGVPSFWILLLNSNYVFTGTSGRPNPDHETVAAMLSQYNGCVIAPSNYSGNALAYGRARWSTSRDNTGDSARVSFKAGQEPLLTLSATITNVAGWALCCDNAGTGGTKVLEIIGFSNGVITSASSGEQIRLTAGDGTLI